MITDLQVKWLVTTGGFQRLNPTSHYEGSQQNTSLIVFAVNWLLTLLRQQTSLPASPSSGVLFSSAAPAAHWRSSRRPGNREGRSVQVPPGSKSRAAADPPAWLECRGGQGQRRGPGRVRQLERVTSFMFRNPNWLLKRLLASLCTWWPFRVPWGF